MLTYYAIIDGGGEILEIFRDEDGSMHREVELELSTDPSLRSVVVTSNERVGDKLFTSVRARRVGTSLICTPWGYLRGDSITPCGAAHGEDVELPGVFVAGADRFVDYQATLAQVGALVGLTGDELDSYQLASPIDRPSSYTLTLAPGNPAWISA